MTDLSKYIAGGQIQQTKVLSKINVQSSGTSVRQYNLSYETAATTQRDRLISIQECGGSAGTDCLRATTVTYQNGSSGVPSPATATGSGATNGTVRTVDIDGDGKLDLVFATTSGANYQWWVQFATASGYGVPVNTGILVPGATANVLMDDFLGDGKAEFLAPNGSLWYAYQWNGSAFTGVSTGLAVDTDLNAGQAASADGDGDGKPDLWTTPAAVPGPFNIYMRRNTSSGGVVSFSTTVVMNGAYQSGTLLPQVRGNNSFTGAAIQHVDTNGNGREEVLVGLFWPYPYPPPAGFSVFAFELPGTTIQAMNRYSGVVTDVLPARWNDDACTDIIQSLGYVVISPCNVNPYDQFYPYYPGSVQFPLAGNAQLALDWDGDGRTDALYNSNGTWYVQRSLATGVATAVSTGIAVGSGTWVVTDRNGDGLSDLAFANASAGNTISYSLHNGASTPADLATTLADGWGISASPTYVPITQSNYTKRTDAVFPNVDFQGPLYVVSQAAQSDGAGGTFTDTFAYVGARIHRQGRGFVGFYRTTTQDSRNSLHHRIFYRQDYPFIGRVSQEDTFQSDGTSVMSRTVNAYQFTDLAGTGCTDRCFPFLDTSSAKTYDITSGSPLVKTTFTDYTYDTYGNATQISTITTDQQAAPAPFAGQIWSSVVMNTVVNDTANWCLGLPTVTTNQNTVPGQAAQTRRVDHEVDAANCRFSSETIEPASTLLKVVTTFGYDTCGNTNSVSVVGLDKTGAAMPARTTTTGYGTRCQFPELVTNALGQTANIAYRYDIGEKSSMTDPNSVVVSWLYDNFGRQTYETRPDGTWMASTYSDCVSASCWNEADLRFHVTTTLFDTNWAIVRTQDRFYDGLNRLRYEQADRVLGVRTNTQTRYDNLGRKTYAYVPYSSASNGYHFFTYDILNRPTADRLYNAGGVLDRQTLMAYAGLQTSITDPLGNVTSEWTDVSGKLRQVSDPSPGGTTNYTYDPFGNLKQMVDATGATSTSTYNIRGFRTASSDPDAGNWSFTPDSLNELVSRTDAKSQTTTFDYDKLGRMVSRVEPESTTATTWTYGTSAASHNIGKLQSLSKPDGYGESYTYDASGRPAQATYTMDATSYQVNYTYNTIGAVDTLTYPTSTSGFRFALKYVYSYGYLQQVKDNAAGTVFWSLSSANDHGSPLTEVLGNGVTITSGYTPWTNELTSRQEGSGGSLSNLQNLSYQWDLNGNLHQRLDQRQGLTEVFVNDAMNRLTSATLNGVPNLTVGYDAAGNITSRSDTGSYDYSTAQPGCSYYAHSQPHAVRKAGASAYCYDADGNMTSRAGAAISWFSYNQPSLIDNGSNRTAQFYYNADHQRWKQIATDATEPTTTSYTIGGVLEKVTRSGVTEFRHLIAGGSSTVIYTRRDNGTTATTYITSDHLGSGDLLMDGAATVLARESFAPFGARRGSNWQGTPTAADYATFAATTRRGFTGHEMLDTVQLIHMKGRVYDPALGRFLSVDPLLDNPGMPQSLNAYGYCVDNPVSCTDPSGYFSLGKLIKTAVTIAVAYYTRGLVSGSAWATCTASGAAWGGVASLAAGGAAMGATTGAMYGGTLESTLKGAVYGGISGGVAGTFSEAGMLGQMIGSGVNGYLQTGNTRGFMRGFAAGGIPQDLGFTDAYLNNGAANLSIGIVRDGMRGGLVSGNSEGIRLGITYGQFNNALGHLVGFTTSGLSAPKFDQGAFIYEGSFWNERGAITFGNVISGPRGLSSLPEFAVHYAHERDHFLNPMEQGFGALYIPAHIADLTVGYTGAMLGQGVGWFPIEEHVQRYPYSTLPPWPR